MRKLALLLTVAFVAGILAGCSKEGTESGAVDKYTEIENQSKAAGGTPQKP
jgi:hypothetical protein